MLLRAVEHVMGGVVVKGPHHVLPGPDHFLFGPVPGAERWQADSDPLGTEWTGNGPQGSLTPPSLAGLHPV
jgi:hypothetical protein